MSVKRIFHKFQGRGKVTAMVSLRSRERSVFGITVVLHRKVTAFRDVQLYLSQPWGLEFCLQPEDYTLIKLTDGAFPSERKASISAYLTRHGLEKASLCPEGTKLVLRFRTQPRGRGGIHVTARRPMLYAQTEADRVPLSLTEPKG